MHVLARPLTLGAALSACISSTAHAVDATAVGTMSELTGHAAMVPCASGATTVGWPVRAGGVDWALAIEHRSPEQTVVWKTQVPIPADQVLVVPAKNDWQRRRMASTGQRSRALTPLLVDDSCAVSLMYVDDGKAMHVAIDAEGKAGEPKAIAKAVANAGNVQALSPNPAHTMVAVLGDSRTARLATASGELVRKVRLPKGAEALRVLPSDEGTLVGLSRKERKGEVSIQATFFEGGTRTRGTTTITGLPLDTGELQAWHASGSVALAIHDPGEQEQVWLAGAVQGTKSTAARSFTQDDFPARIQAAGQRYPYMPGGFKILAIEPLPQGGLAVAGRSSGYTVKRTLEADGSTDTRVTYQYGDVLVHRMAPDGSEAWTASAGGGIKKGGIGSGYAELPMAVDEAGVHLLYQGGGCGTRSGGACAVSLAFETGDVTAFTPFKGVYPVYGQLDGRLAQRSTEGAWTLGLRTVPFSIRMKKWDDGAGVFMTFDSDAPPAKRAILAFGTGDKSSSDYRAGQAFAAIDHRRLTPRPFFHGLAMGSAIGAVGGLLVPIDDSVIGGAIARTGAGPSLAVYGSSVIGAGYTAGRGYGWWTSQSPEFRAGYRKATRKGKVRAGLGAILATSISYSAIVGVRSTVQEQQ